MKQQFDNEWDQLHRRMLGREWLGGALLLGFQLLVVTGLIFGIH